MPIYAGTKHAVIGLTKSWGIPEFYDETKVRVIGICPGVTMTPLITDIPQGKLMKGIYEHIKENDFDALPKQQ